MNPKHIDRIEINGLGLNRWREHGSPCWWHQIIFPDGTESRIEILRKSGTDTLVIHGDKIRRALAICGEGVRLVYAIGLPEPVYQQTITINRDEVVSGARVAFFSMDLDVILQREAGK